MISPRNARGNMLFLVVLSIGLIIGAGMMGFMFNRFLSHKARAQSRMDAEALSMASRINVGNRVGQINQLVQGSRELVYLSRERFDKCQKDDASFLGPLSYQLLVEARNGQALVEAERNEQIRHICREIQEAALEYNAEAELRGKHAFCWPSAAEARIENISIGSIVNTDSNVKSLDVIQDLAEFDRSNGYINAKSGLYKADINAKLPNEGDLNFHFSSLPANVEGSCSPARNANSHVFLPAAQILENGQPAQSSSKNLPNAIQISSSLPVSASDSSRSDSAKFESAKSESSLKLISTGVTGGDSSQTP